MICDFKCANQSLATRCQQIQRAHLRLIYDFLIQIKEKSIHILINPGGHYRVIYIEQKLSSINQSGKITSDQQCFLFFFYAYEDILAFLIRDLELHLSFFYICFHLHEKLHIYIEF